MIITREHRMTGRAKISSSSCQLICVLLGSFAVLLSPSSLTVCLGPCASFDSRLRLRRYEEEKAQAICGLGSPAVNNSNSILTQVAAV